jgi:hypothetical protein
VLLCVVAVVFAAAQCAAASSKAACVLTLQKSCNLLAAKHLQLLQLLRCVAAHCNFLHFTAQLAKWLKIKHLARTTFLR